MKKTTVKTIPDYLDSWTWDKRLTRALNETPDWFDGNFAKANSAYVQEIAAATGENARLHVIFNIGADALREFTLTGDYKNVYEHPVVEGKELAPSKKRLSVDRIVGLDTPQNYYFCSLSVGGTGMRFYGEYCVVLRSPDDAVCVKRVLDRNSYDFVSPPLSLILDGCTETEQRRLAAKLTCTFRSTDLGEMLSIKVLQHYARRPRLLTIGTVGEAVLSDEDYVEAFHEGKIKLKSVLEVRSHPYDEMTESSIEDRFERGEIITPEELQWTSRR